LEIKTGFKKVMYFSAKELGLAVYGVSSGNELIARCPFPEHIDSEPSASFNTVKGVLYCFGCGRSATVTQIADMLGGYVKVSPTADRYNKIKDTYWRQLLLNPLAYDHPYLTKRMVSNEQVKEFGIRANGNGVIFPFTKNGRIVGVQVRQIVHSPKYLTFGYKVPLWPDTRYQVLHTPIIITEGIFSTLRLLQFGFKSYATLGALMKFAVKDYLRQYPKVIGVFDDDKAGYLACGRLLKLVPHAKVLVRGIDVGDILDKIRLLEYTGNQTITSDLVTVAKAYGDKKEFFERMGR